MASSELSFGVAAQLLRRIFEKELPPLGFRLARELSFSRQIKDGLALINVSTRHGPNRELWFSYGTGVRFPRIEQILASADDDLIPTIGVPASMLSKAEQCEWCVDNKIAAQHSAASAMAHIKEHAIPF